MLDEPIIAGPLPTAVFVVGLLAAAGLLVGRSRRWWLRTVPIAVACGVVAAALVGIAVVVFRPFPDALPVRVLVWIGVFAAAVALGVAQAAPDGAGARWPCWPSPSCWAPAS